MQSRGKQQANVVIITRRGARARGMHNIHFWSTDVVQTRLVQAQNLGVKPVTREEIGVVTVVSLPSL